MLLNLGVPCYLDPRLRCSWLCGRIVGAGKFTAGGKPNPCWHFILGSNSMPKHGIGQATAAHMSRVSAARHAIGLGVAWAKAYLLPPAGIDSKAGNVADSYRAMDCMHRLPHLGSARAAHA